MNIRGAIGILAGVAVFTNFGCVDTSAKRSPEISPVSTVGPNPTLPQPEGKKLIPTVRVAEAIGWPSGRTPIGADGLAVSAFASGLAHPRWLYVLPNGDVLYHAIGEFITPSGERLEGKGVVPDEPVTVTRADLLAGRDPVINAAMRWIAGEKSRRTGATP